MHRDSVTCFEAGGVTDIVSWMTKEIVRTLADCGRSNKVKYFFLNSAISLCVAVR
jgi:hypothetical protein